MKLLALIAFFCVISEIFCARKGIKLGDLNGKHYVRNLNLTKPRPAFPYLSPTNVIGNESVTSNKVMHYAGSWVYALIEENDTLPFVSFPGISVISHLRGGPVNVYVLDRISKDLSITRIGPRESDMVASVPVGAYVGIDLKRRRRKGSFALMSLTVCPGADISRVTKAGKKKLLQEFPKEKRVIEKLSSR